MKTIAEIMLDVNELSHMERRIKEYALYYRNNPLNLRAAIIYRQHMKHFLSIIEDSPASFIFSSGFSGENTRENTKKRLADVVQDIHVALEEAQLARIELLHQENK